MGLNVAIFRTRSFQLNELYVFSSICRFPFLLVSCLPEIYYRGPVKVGEKLMDTVVGSICSPVRRGLVPAFSISPSYCTQKNLMKLHLRTAFTLSFSTFYFRPSSSSSSCAKSVSISLSLFRSTPETPLCREEENEIFVLYPIFSAFLHFPLRRGGRKGKPRSVGRAVGGGKEGFSHTRFA